MLPQGLREPLTQLRVDDFSADVQHGQNLRGSAPDSRHRDMDWPPARLIQLRAYLRKLRHAYADRVEAMMLELPILTIDARQAMACACRAAVVQLDRNDC